MPGRLMMPWRGPARSAPKRGPIPPVAGPISRLFDDRGRTVTTDPFGRYKGAPPEQSELTGGDFLGLPPNVAFMNDNGWTRVRECGNTNSFLSSSAPAVQCNDGRVDGGVPAGGTESTIGGWDIYRDLPPAGANARPGTSWGRSSAIPPAPAQVRLPAGTYLPQVHRPTPRPEARVRPAVAAPQAVPDDAEERIRARSRVVGTYQLRQALRAGTAVRAELFAVIPQRRLDRAAAVAAAVRAGESAPPRGATVSPTVIVPPRTQSRPIPGVTTGPEDVVVGPAAPGAVVAARITRHRAVVRARAVAEAALPPKQHVEVKLAFRMAAPFANWIGYNITTELRDLVDALWKNLKPECKQYQPKSKLRGKNWRRRRDKFEPTRVVGRIMKPGNPSFRRKLNDVMNHLDCIQWNPWYRGLTKMRGASMDISFNTIEDSAFALLGLAALRARARTGWTAGIQFGGGVTNKGASGELGVGSPIDRIADAIGF